MALSQILNLKFNIASLSPTGIVVPLDVLDQKLLNLSLQIK